VDISTLNLDALKSSRSGRIVKLKGVQRGGGFNIYGPPKDVRGILSRPGNPAVVIRASVPRLDPDWFLYFIAHFLKSIQEKLIHQAFSAAGAGKF
jgi:hypothetical protein